MVQVTLFYPPHLGGVERVAQTLAELLAEHRDVLVLTTTCGSEGAPLVERSGRLTVRRSHGLEAAHTPVSPGLALQLMRLPRGAIVHAHLGQAFLPEMTWLTSRLRKRSYILHFHLDVDPSGSMGVLLPLYNRHVLGPVLRRAAGVIVLSQEQADFIAAEYRVEPARIVVIPNGVPPQFFLERPTAPETGDGPLRLLSVGRLSVQKNVPRLLQALALVEAPVELVLVGDGDERPRVEQLIEQLGLRHVRRRRRGAWRRAARVVRLGPGVRAQLRPRGPAPRAARGDGGRAPDRRDGRARNPRAARRIRDPDRARARRARGRDHAAGRGCGAARRALRARPRVRRGAQLARPGR